MTTVVGPLVVLFGLDYTIWPFYVGTEAKPPFTKDSAGQVTDSTGKIVSPFPEVLSVFQKLQSLGIKVGVSTINVEPDISTELLKLFDLEKYITYKELRFLNYKEVARKMKEYSNAPSYTDILFFDDSQFNTRILSDIGIYSVFVSNGMTLSLLEQGLKEFEQYKASGPVGLQDSDEEFLRSNFSVYPRTSKLLNDVFSS